MAANNEVTRRDFVKTILTGLSAVMGLVIGIPALPPGEYVLLADMIDVDQTAFSQFGQESFAWEFRVRAE